MTDIVSKINDDMKEYEFLCEYFREKPKYKKDIYDNDLLDCYSKHAQKLTERWKKIKTKMI